MTLELPKVLILPGVLTGSLILVVLAQRHGMPTAANRLLLAGWLIASLGLTLVARETRQWPFVGYLQNFVAFLGLSGVPFAVAYAVSSFLQARGSGTATSFGIPLVLSLLAILPAALVGPVWAMFLRTDFGWKYITYP